LICYFAPWRRTTGGRTAAIERQTLTFPSLTLKL
jgi:hypothetical protein